MACSLSPRLPWRLFSVAALALLGLGLAAPTLPAQSYDASNLRQPTDLGVTWLVHAGDDPAYAQPGFDDSHWERFNPGASIKTIFPNTEPDVIWYRLRMKVAPSETGLALEEWNISSAFDIYVNGERLIHSGQVAPFAPYTFSARLLARIPDRQVATGSLVIALRVHISHTEWGSAYAGYYVSNLTLGQEYALREHLWLTLIGENAATWFNDLLGLGLGIVALALFTAQRRQWEYVWIFLQFFATSCALPLIAIEYLHNVPVAWDMVRLPLTVASSLFTVLMYFAFLRMRFGWWIRVAFAIAAAGLVLSLVGQAQGNISSIASVLALSPLLLLVSGVIPVLLVVHLRRGNREAGILLVPVILQSLMIYAQVLVFAMSEIPGMAGTSLRLSTLLFSYPIGPFTVGLNQVSGLLYLLALAIIMVLRSTRISRQQALLESEVAAAREVQQIILPEQVEAVRGFTVDSIYQPAQQVGGDFFQVLPADRGGLLVVMGDVAGKGLPAAMLVSVLVGAIRGVAEFTNDPAELLANLNDRLIGRAGGGFSTALAAHIAANGSVTIANAGHLSPYLDGVEIDLPGALPLGVECGARYSISEFRFEPGSRLTFYSDGVVEAQNLQGELFGFERGREFSTQPAAAIVEAARQFGQQDDITVVTIERDLAIASAA
jgi:sigma-B regulation protein RsbU (phosphoserine phosphatase)